jgi:hypothetical protein
LRLSSQTWLPINEMGMSRAHMEHLMVGMMLDSRAESAIWLP